MKKPLSIVLMISFLIEICAPSISYGLTSGPSQPEVESFEPVSTNNMVDLFSGDFNYNIPLMQVGDYPINIAYHAGSTMDEEASWVGLGWNINCGVINRGMRGLPDDFNGDQIVKTTTMKPNKTISFEVPAGNVELFGTTTWAANFTLGLKYNNYNGLSLFQSMGISSNNHETEADKSPFTAGLSVSSSTDEGLSVQPSLSFQTQQKLSEKRDCSLSGSIGLPFNSRTGLSVLTVSASVGFPKRNKEINVQQTAAAADKDEIIDKMSESGTIPKGIVEESKDKYQIKTNSNLSGAVKFRDYIKSALAVQNVSASSTFNLAYSTYSPSIIMPMNTFSMSGHYATGVEFVGISPNVSLDASYSTQSIANTVVSKSAYGTLYSSKGQRDNNALLDFTRDNDIPFNKYITDLPITNMMPDVFGLSGQGIGGSYRLYRNDIGFVFDPEAKSTSTGITIGVEMGVGNAVHGGANIAVNMTNTTSNLWSVENDILYKIGADIKSNSPLYESVYFKEANEKSVNTDEQYLAGLGGYKASRFKLDERSKYEIRLTNKLESQNLTGGITDFALDQNSIHTKRVRRQQAISYLTNSNYKNFALQEFPVCSKAMPHHITEISSVNADGNRYIYGYPIYNTVKKDVTFSIGSKKKAETNSHFSSSNNLEIMNGLVNYSTTEASVRNKNGQDNYYSSMETPPFAHSYFLTAVVSSDYVDIDNVRGPSDWDFGTYTRFAYKKIDNYKWRTPVERDKAAYNEGLKSDWQDDRANYSYGEKELVYLDSIITKNMVAIFYTSEKLDGKGVTDERGGISGGTSVLKLDSIRLFQKKDLEISGTSALPVKTAHFKYSYDLCTGTPNSEATNKGKLTLKELWFTYGSSQRAKFSPYQFYYNNEGNSNQVSYNSKAYDRWGNYMPFIKTIPTTQFSMGSFNDMATYESEDLFASEFPYVDQDKVNADAYAATWNLSEIILPSGGKINIEYESDDYAFVQNRKAMQMFTIEDVANGTEGPQIGVSKQWQAFNGSSPKFYFKIKPGNEDINSYINSIGKYVYYRFLVDLKKTSDTRPHAEYISGYAEIDPTNYGYDPVTQLGYIGFKPKHINDASTSDNVCPIQKAAIQFGRLNMPKTVWGSDEGMDDVEGISLNIIQEIWNSSIIKNLMDAVKGPNNALKGYGVASRFLPAKSWIRLLSPDGHKQGGGYRVKSIRMVDDWQAMTQTTGSANPYQTATYGQDYFYDLPDGSSSGVASYEPLLGGDENPFKQPVEFETNNRLAPNDLLYLEEPFGESAFPSPSVGYSKVTVRNYTPSGITRRGTGKVVNEFYTAKDFPTYTDRTLIDPRYKATPPFGLGSILRFLEVKDYFTASQGFYVETNDMHGKPKAIITYQEGNPDYISKTEYKYKYTGNEKTGFRLDNQCEVIYPDGSHGKAEIGVNSDFIGDFRESVTTAITPSLNMNLDAFVIIWGFAIPRVIPGYSSFKTQFRSATNTKVVQKFGILDEIVNSDGSSVVSIKNQAYDATTGNPLLTSTTTDFNDPVYSLELPAYWYYTSMGPAYENIGMQMANLTLQNGYLNYINASSFFNPGDVLALDGPAGKFKAWVTEVAGNRVKIVKKDGSLVNGSIQNLAVLESGKRNNLGIAMANIATKNNPIDAISTNSYSNVLSASSVQFSNHWRTYCDCFTEYLDIIEYSKNPYILGTTGEWKVWRNYVYLTDRTQSVYDGNTNIRKDGEFTSFNPFYKNANGKWVLDFQNWTFASEVTETHPFGEELENKDALGNFSSALYGYRQTLPIAVAANARHKDVAFDNYEDDGFGPCVDDHFKIGFTNTNTKSHTGKNSLKVDGISVILEKQTTVNNCAIPPDCDIKLSKTNDDPPTSTILVEGGYAPISLEYEVIEGSPYIMLSNGGTSLDINSSVPWKVKVIVQDSKGCSKSLIFNN